MKLNLENLTATLAREGINGEEITVTKNGVICTGFRVFNPENPNVSPVVYYSQDETLESFMAKVRSAICLNPPRFESDKIFSKEYLKEHLVMGIQKKHGSDDSIVTREILNVELYLRIIIDQSDHHSVSIKVTEEALESMQISEEEAWEFASDNMKAHFRVMSLAHMLGFPDEDFGSPFQVLTAKDNLDGATALAFPEFLEEYLTEIDEDWCYILPSSTQELLIVPGSECNDFGMNPKFFAEMVEEVNSAEVDPLIQLDPVCYRYDLGDDCVQIAAMVFGEVK